MTKKIISVVMVLLMVLSIVPVALAETADDRNYTIKTEFYAYDEVSDDWVPATTASGGENLKLRVFVDTNYVSGPATLLLAYDKSAVVANLPESGAAKELKLNPDDEFYASNDIQAVRGAHGVNAANIQYGYGNITDEEYEKYSFIVASISTYGCIRYDGSDWLFEVDMTVLKGKSGENFECTILPKTSMTKTNRRGMTNFPYAPAVSSDLTTVSSAYMWYEGTPVVEPGKVDVIADVLVPELYNVTLDANGGAFANGDGTLIVPVESYAKIPAFETPVREGYNFAGWDAEIPEKMPEEDIAFTARWTAKSYNAKFNANGGLFADGSEIKTVAFEYGADVTSPESPVMQGYEFAGWAESADGSAVENLGQMGISGKTYYATWIAASDVAYIVESYVMTTDGAYNVTSTAYSGTTGETVTYEYTDMEGFEFNEEKSVLSGVIAADGSLVLKVYSDRKVYKFTTVANGVETSTDYLYGAAVATPATPYVQGYAFADWDDVVPATMPARDVTLTAKFDCVATLKIKNNPTERTVKYGETLRLTTETANVPAGAYVKWEVAGSGVEMSQNSDGTICELTSTSSGTVKVTAKLVDANGNVLSGAYGEISDSQQVVSKAGIWQKIVSFFKNLFGMNRTIIQLFKAF